MIRNIQELMNKSTREEIDKYSVEELTDEQQHYVPIIYLKGFSKDGFVLVYDLQNKCFLGNGEYIPPKSICRDGDFYVAMTKDKKYNYAIEKVIFSDFLEGNIPLVIGKLKKQEKIDEFEYNVLASFIAFQFLRTEKQKSEYEESVKLMHKFNIMETMGLSGDGNYDIFSKRAEQYQKKTGKNLGDIKKLFNSTKDMELNIILPKEKYIKHMLKMSVYIAQYLLNSNIIIYHTKKNNKLITSDNPCYIIPPKGRKYVSGEYINGIGFLLPTNARKIIHLSETIAIECLPHEFIPGGKITHKFLNQKETQTFNSYIVKNAKRFIIGSSKENIENTIKKINFKYIEELKKIPIVKYFEDKKIVGTFGIYPL